MCECLTFSYIVVLLELICEAQVEVCAPGVVVLRRELPSIRHNNGFGIAVNVGLLLHITAWETCLLISMRS